MKISVLYIHVLQNLKGYLHALTSKSLDIQDAEEASLANTVIKMLEKENRLYCSSKGKTDSCNSNMQIPLIAQNAEERGELSLTEA